MLKIKRGLSIALFPACLKACSKRAGNLPWGKKEKEEKKFVNIAFLWKKICPPK